MLEGIEAQHHIWIEPFTSSLKSHDEIDMRVSFGLRTVFIKSAANPTPARVVKQILREDLSGGFGQSAQGLEQVNGESHSSLQKPSPSSFTESLGQEINAAYARFRSSVRQTAPRFRPWDSGYRGTGPTEVNQLIALSESEDMGGGEAPVFYLNDVTDVAVQARTAELPGNFPFSVKEHFIRESMKNWKSLSKACSAEVEEIITNHIEVTFRSFAGANVDAESLNKARCDILTELHKRSVIMTEKINIISDGEERIYTQSDQLFSEYRRRWYGKYSGILLKVGKAPGVSVESLPTTMETARGEGWEDCNKAMDRAPASLIELDIYVQTPDLVNAPPMDLMEPALHIMAEVRAYIQVAEQRFCDSIPQQIDRTFLQGLEDWVGLLCPTSQKS